MNSTESIIERAKRIIPRHFSDDIYHVTFVRKEGIWPRTEIIVYNKELPLPTNRSRRSRDFYCINCEIVDEKPSILHIGLLTRCGLRGATHLDQLISFSKECGFSQITLEDESMIMYTAEDGPTNTHHFINLQQLLRLMTGHSWYEKFGFTNANIKRRQDDIQADIKQPIRIYPKELFFRIQDYVTEITPDAASDITPDISISKAVSYLYECLKTVCPERKCHNDDDLNIVDDINSILNELYEGMLSRLGMEERYFHDLQLDLLPNQKGSSRKTRRTQRQYNKKVHKASYKRRTRRNKNF